MVDSGNVTDSGISDELLRSVVLLLAAAAGTIWLLFFKQKSPPTRQMKKFPPAEFRSERNYVDDYQYSLDLQLKEVMQASLHSQVTSTEYSSTQARATFNAYEDKVTHPTFDAYDLQLQEVMQASLYSQLTSTEPLSTRSRVTLNAYEDKVSRPSRISPEILMEDEGIWETFDNDYGHHSLGNKWIASSTTQPRPTFNGGKGMSKVEEEVTNSLQITCEICMDDKEIRDFFELDCCHHSFCNECISQHIVAKLQVSPDMIRCPGEDCKASLDVSTCRSIIPVEAAAKWDASLCQSVIPDSQKMYCPYRNCSAMLINDSGDAVMETLCPFCQRRFCAACRVPWHSEFTCKEFKKLNDKKGKKDEKMLQHLAKKKNWQKCPSCKIHVERTEGCLHMTCRCKYEFCYRCGTKWSDTHICKKY